MGKARSLIGRNSGQMECIVCTGRGNACFSGKVYKDRGGGYKKGLIVCMCMKGPDSEQYGGMIYARVEW